MRKLILVLFASALLANLSFADDQKAMDLIVVLDTSSSMYAHHQQVSDYVIGPLLKDFLRYGDTFHLISFSSSAKIEISRKIEGIGDIETIIGRLLLLYPLNQYSDLIAALQYTARYLSDLPENRTKTVVFITDGDQSPAPSSPNKGLSAEAVNTAIKDAAVKLKGNGWIFHYIRVPEDLAFRNTDARPAASIESKSSKDNQGATAQSDKNAETIDTNTNTVSNVENASQSNDVSSVVANELNIPVTDLDSQHSTEIISTTIGAIAVEFPSTLGKTTRNITIPLTVKNPSPNSVYLETQAVLVDGIDRLDKKSFKEIQPRSEATLNLNILLPESYQPGAMTLRIEPRFAGSIRINPESALVRLDLVNGGITSWILTLIPLLLLIGGIILAALLALFIILFLRKLHNNPSSAMSEAVRINQEERAKKDTNETDIMAEFAKIKEEEKQKGPGLPPKNAVFAEKTSQRESTQKIKPLRSTPTPIPPSLQADTVITTGVKPSMALEPSIAVRRTNGRIMLSLFVQDQNTAIGKRNVHLMKAGHRLTVGGHNSDFLIFLVPLPHRIADIHFDGEQLILIPRRPEFFPDTGADPIYDCVDKTIHIRSAKGYDLYIRFEKYQDPLQTLNNFLRSIEIPGKNIIL